MATKVNVKGKLVSRPGVYSQIASGVTNPSVGLSFGNICIIDTGFGAGFGGGAGINGTLANGSNAIYGFDTIQDYQSFVKGGMPWLLGSPLFKPAQNGIDGVSKVFYIRAATTKNATITYTLTNGTLKINTLDEGLNANGVALSGELTGGYGAKLVQGKIDTTKFIIQFYIGTFKGVDSMNSNTPYDNTLQSQVKGQLFLQSPEFLSIADFITWANADYNFNQHFKLDATSTATGNFVAADITDNPGYKLAAGGTESYASTDMDAVLAQIKNLDNTFFLSTEFGADATSSANVKILDFCENEAKYEKFLVVGGGYDSSKFKGGSDSSQGIAEFFDSDKVIVIHGGAKKNIQGGGTKVYSQLYKAANYLGRLCGLEPQVPVTLKSIGIDGEVHQLTDDEQEFALEKGIGYTYYDYELGQYVIGQDINTLQNNTFLVNNDGTSFSVSVMRIVSQLNKEIIVGAKKVFFGSNNGPNRNTITENDIKLWTEGFLQSYVATSLQDNLIITFRNVIVTVDQDNYFVSYEFVPNLEVSKIIFSGILLES